MSLWGWGCRWHAPPLRAAGSRGGSSPGPCTRSVHVNGHVADYVGSMFWMCSKHSYCPPPPPILRSK
eukprot:1158947-Pelagomonas_calceolata.AAC.11